MVHSTFEDDALGAKKVRNLPKINFDLDILTFSNLVLSSVKKIDSDFLGYKLSTR